MSSSINKIILGFAGATILATAANAGGFSRGTADTDILYEDGNFVSRSSMTFVSPKQNLTSQGYGASESSDLLESYVIPSFAMKLEPVEDIACAGTYTTPFGGKSDYSGTTLGFDVTTAKTTGSVKQDFVTNELGLTCGVSFNAGPGKFTILGGAFYQSLDFEQLIGYSPKLGGPTLALRLSDHGYGYRVGAAYEIPEIALRAQLMYRSAVNVDATGTLDILSGGTANPFATGKATFPQSVELKVQSGVAPGWLVYGGVKWTDWSVFDVLEYNATGTPASLNFFWKDGWTINGGVAHQLNDALAVTAGLTWDRGVGTGHDLQESDVWTASAGASFKPSENVEFRGGVGYSWFGAASQDFTAGGGVGSSVPAPGIKTAESGSAIGVNISAKIKF
ncbi:OmpP1/FadL family transporter [Ahrensia sp. 13_GOM-1096m]|uniref:OmpP1/FadL family transporter n=1 Tax=Ahrensia sp. 13_GOM-1096m TaxID=1380380 RepID=UPI0006870D31|nr:outer membrane protein transport protein [Ahrensia sp. 13_GOM-1096m]